MIAQGCDKPLVPLGQFMDLLKPYVVSRDEYNAKCSRCPQTSQLLKKLSTYHETSVGPSVSSA